MFTFRVQPVSMVSVEGLQRVDLHFNSDRTEHLYLSVYGQEAVVQNIPVAFSAGQGVAGPGGGAYPL